MYPSASWLGFPNVFKNAVFVQLPTCFQHSAPSFQSWSNRGSRANEQKAQKAAASEFSPSKINYRSFSWTTGRLAGSLFWDSSQRLQSSNRQQNLENCDFCKMGVFWSVHCFRKSGFDKFHFKCELNPNFSAIPVCEWGRTLPCMRIFILTHWRTIPKYIRLLRSYHRIMENLILQKHGPWFKKVLLNKDSFLNKQSNWVPLNI